MAFLQQLQSKKGQLRPTETIVRPHPAVQTGFEEAGLNCLGGAIEEERTESEAATASAAARCAEALRTAQCAVVYTGAGVSTATGISDYRGPDGVWTSLAKGRIPDESFDYTGASPSYTHMSIAKLIQEGYLKLCTSTNLDGLHYKSGLQPLVNLAEVHGNKFCERCPACNEEVVRPFPIRRTPDRRTGRLCPACGCSFTDSGIDFGQSLPVRHLELAEAQAKRSDFSLVVGTSMRVRPASDMPFYGEGVAPDGVDGDGRAQVCIVNRQDTPYDARAAIRSFGDADLFFFHVMKELGLQTDVPPDGFLYTSTQMTRLAAKFMPPRDGHYVGEEELANRMDEALGKAEAELLAGTRKEGE